MITEMKKLHQEILHFVIGGMIGLTVLIGMVMVISSSRVMPGVMIAGVEVGGNE